MFYTKIIRNLVICSIALANVAAASDLSRVEAERILKLASQRAVLEMENSVDRATREPDAIKVPNRNNAMISLERIVAIDDDLKNTPIPKNIFTAPPPPKMSHISAIGEVRLNHWMGTGSYLGQHIVITAAHVISRLFKGKAPTQSGPHYVNVAGQGAYWIFDPKVRKDGKKDGQRRHIAIVGLVAESMYVNGVNHGDKYLSHDQQKYDIAFLILDPSKTYGLPEMPLIDTATGFNPMCAMVGYAPLKGGKQGRHKVAVKLSLSKSLREWDVLHLNSDFHVDAGQKDKLHKQAESLLDTALPQGFDNVSDVIRGGDSGGPLIVQALDGRKFQVGVNSVSSTKPGAHRFSGCASLMMGSQKTGWVLSPKVKAMWDYAKAMQQQHHK